MRIPDGYTKRVVGPGKVRSRGAAAVAGVTGAAPVGAAVDSVEVSSRSFEVQRARALALAAPEIREALVDEIMGLIHQGDYQVTGQEVAPVLIREHLADAGFAGAA
ncbi:MAG: flagellar biosynthesis anti-sigma factor FlgM [Deltaproteobacteria bacterium]|nr:flagellar biosynthesis anti-sigma factor FlgM [Deltaproteobacteria bacterium]